MSSNTISPRENMPLAVYGGYIDDNEKLMKSASGGIATALSERMIELGGYVAGAAYDASFEKIEYIIVDNINDLDKLKCSKYAESEKNNIYIRTIELLKQGHSVLFTGLPCEVAALNKMTGGKYDSLITCELVCHGPTLKKVHQEYICYLKEKYKSQLVAFNLRYKKNGWHPSYLQAVFANGVVYEKPFYHTEYGVAFSILSRPACFKCAFKGERSTADITIGDYWGAQESDVFWNENGVSVIFVHTTKGYNYLRDIEKVRLFESSFEHAVAKNQNVIRPRKKPDNYDVFLELFETRGLKYAVKQTQSMKSNIISLIRLCIPQRLITLLKKLSAQLKS